ncbi:MAG TPA: tripartite tricarboxylate transporter substrate binding protein [Burkholderiales bacterium]|nr:tripartite tricarboxylate transporter substrate binding protein [Burkholderiales bacterium]
MRHGIASSLALLAMTGVPITGHSQAYPGKPVRLISPFAAGGGADTIARFFAQRLSASLQQQIVVDNRPGAGSVIGTEAAAKAPPDGYTILIVNDTHAINASLVRKLPYDPVGDFAPITLIAVTPFMLSVHPSLPVKSVRDLVKLAKSRPGQLNYASAGNGSVAHFGGELLKLSTGIAIVHVPYRGVTGTVAAVTSGEAHMMITSPLTALSLVRAGKLRALAVTGTNRMQIAPEVPTMQESGVKDYELTSSYGLLAPRKTPEAAIATLNQSMVRALKADDVRARLRDEAVEAVGSTPEEFQKYLAEQTAKYAKIVRATGMKNE